MGWADWVALEGGWAVAWGVLGEGLAVAAVRAGVARALAVGAQVERAGAEQEAVAQAGRDREPAAREPEAVLAAGAGQAREAVSVPVAQVSEQASVALVGLGQA